MFLASSEVIKTLIYLLNYFSAMVKLERGATITNFLRGAHRMMRQSRAPSQSRRPLIEILRSAASIYC